MLNEQFVLCPHSPKEITMPKPNPLNRISGGYQASIIVLTSVRAGLFTALADSRLTAAAIARKIGWNAAKTSRICDTLVVNDLLKKHEGKYYNTTVAKRFLVKGKPQYQGNILEHHWHLLHRWINLGTVLREDYRAPKVKPKRTKEQLQAFILGMKDRTSEGARDFLKHVDLSWARNVLDLGGGPGTFAIKFCKHYRRLKATVLDLPEVIPITKQEISAERASRVRTLAADMLKGNYGKDFDLVFISNIIHSYDLPTNKKIFNHSYKALASKGKIMIKDFYVNDKRTGPYFPIMFSINMMLGTTGGDTYTMKEIREILRQVGFRKVQTVEVGQDSITIIGEKP